jgi:FkbM family methyltransferase
MSPLFPRVYALARRAGVVDKPWFEAVFTRSYFLYKRWLEDPFHGLARRSPELFHSGHVIDVGANIGYDAMVFADAVDPGFRVLALEPEARNFAMLERAIARRGLAARVTALRLAVGAADGTADLWRNLDHHGDHRVATEAFRRAHPTASTQTVPMRSLDSLAETDLPGPIAFVKIDVQGYELAVCQGMRRVLAENARLAVAFEYAPEAMREMGSGSSRAPGLVCGLPAPPAGEERALRSRLGDRPRRRDPPARLHGRAGVAAGLTGGQAGHAA